jgi:hypothetical protein
LDIPETVRRLLAVHFTFPPATWETTRAEVIDVLRSHPGWPLSKVAKHCGVTKSLAQRAKKTMESEQWPVRRTA